MKISAIPAFRDNYIWLLQVGDQALVVDPGDATPVLRHLLREGLELAAILVTHHHADHQGGISELLPQVGDIPVYGPKSEAIAGCSVGLAGGERLNLLGLDVSVMAVPGHTRGHLTYVLPDAAFCGDTLFGAGCGRLFEGTPAQMLLSLKSLMALPSATRLYCAHEYTAANLRFAAAVEPENFAIAERIKRVAELRAAGVVTACLDMDEERATNPFLRCAEAAVIAAARARGASDSDELAVFTAIRQWKNEFV